MGSEPEVENVAREEPKRGSQSPEDTGRESGILFGKVTNGGTRGEDKEDKGEREVRGDEIEESGTGYMGADTGGGLGEEDSISLEREFSDHDGSTTKEKACMGKGLESSVFVGAEPSTLENLCEGFSRYEGRWRRGMPDRLPGL